MKIMVPPQAGEIRKLIRRLAHIGHKYSDEYFERAKRIIADYCEKKGFDYYLGGEGDWGYQQLGEVTGRDWTYVITAFLTYDNRRVIEIEVEVMGK